MSNPRKKRAIEKEDGGEADFDRLPHELVLEIFKKLVDVKALWFSSAVCRRFASIVPLVDHVVLVSPGFLPAIVWSTLFSGTLENYVTRPLKKFKEIRRLDLEVPYAVERRDKYFKWKGAFGMGEKIENFVCFSFTSIHKKQKEPRLPSPSGFSRYMLECLHDSLRRHEVVLTLLNQYPFLERVSITDSKKHGTICLRNEKLNEMRDFVPSDLDDHHSLREWHVPILELSSGYVIEGAELAIMGTYAYTDGDFEDGNVIPKDLGVGNEVFGEAVKEIMMNHGSKMSKRDFVESRKRRRMRFC